MSAPLLLIASGKGGVGKTTLATNLAARLATQGLRVLLVDLDLGLANVDVMLRLAPRATSEDALSAQRPLRECITSASGFDVLAAASGVAELADLERPRLESFVEQLGELAGDYDVVLGDGAAGLGRDVLTFAARASLVWIVTTPDPAALSDAYGLLKALDQDARRRDSELATPELVLNCVSGVDEARELANKLAAVAERFLARAPRLAGWLPRSTRVQQACRRQTLFASGPERGLEAHCLGELARRVARLVAPAGAGAALAQA